MRTLVRIALFAAAAFGVGIALLLQPSGNVRAR